MAHFVIETTTEEQDKVLAVLKELEGTVVPVCTIAEKADMRPSRTRYVIMDLISAGKIRRVASKAFNKHYVRYTYEVL
jgi:predicted Rossmann fold nucleotide-binding protein DprA/Smf involved in DNA uptake